MIRHVVWDWNGTLLDDVDPTVFTLNSLLEERRMPLVTREEYRDRFGFPVRAFYEGLGFDFGKEDFAALSIAFIERYRARGGAMRLWSGALEVMAALEARGVGQMVVSAMERGLLGRMLAEHGVAGFLAGHHGREDLQAGSKVELGVGAVRAAGLRPEEVLVVGDTLHDQELARAIGCRVALFAGGHQSPARLSAAGAPVIERLEELPPLLDW
jgi:phosphoglycolate phosphatase